MKKILKILSYILKSAIGLVIFAGILLIVGYAFTYIYNLVTDIHILRLTLNIIVYILKGVSLFILGFGVFTFVEDKIKEYFKKRKREKRNYE